MTDLVVFHSAQGLRGGIEDWADRFRRRGDHVWTPDLFESQTFARLEDGIAAAAPEFDPTAAELRFERQVSFLERVVINRSTIFTGELG